MKLGEFVEISVSVTDLMRSLTFYERLGFRKIEQSWEPWPWVILTDGTVILNLSQYSVPSKPILSYIANDMYRIVEQLKILGFEMTPLLSREIPGTQGFIAPGGIGLALVEHSTRKITPPAGESLCHCGDFKELAFPVPDLRGSLDFWLQVGFEVKRSNEFPSPWASLSDGLIQLGLYQSGGFSEAALSYTSDDTVERIRGLKQKGYRFRTELPSLLGGLGKAVMETPDKQLLLFLEKAMD